MESPTVQKAAGDAGIPITTEITLNTEYQHSSSNADTMSSVSGVDSHEDFSHETVSSVETIQPYAVSDVRLDISDADIDSGYHNPYAQFMFEHDITSTKSSVTKCFSETSAEESEISVAQSPTSEPTLERSASIRSKVSSPGVYTRQLNMFIGEEWETVQQHWPLERRAVSCPGTLRGPRGATIQQPLKSYEENIRRLEMIQSRRQHQLTSDPLRFFFNISHEEPPIQKDYMIKPNPYNKINHMIHSLLHCPCFFFFYLLCCLPGVHVMQMGDIEFKAGHKDRAKKFGHIATVLYLLGAIIGTVALGAIVFVAVAYVQSQSD